MKAIILLSGGLDSTVLLAMAVQAGRSCLALSFNYGQRHLRELESARRIAAHYQVPLKIIMLDPENFSTSALVSGAPIAKDRSTEDIQAGGIPNTYVPARNTLFLSFALGQAEVFGAQEIYFGANAMDNSYPDCQKEYLEAYQQVMNLATKQAVEDKAPRLVTPFLNSGKADIIHMGYLLNAPMEMSFSCYSPIEENQACESCDACHLRHEGFALHRKNLLCQSSYEA